MKRRNPIVDEIAKYRTICLIHRYLYYVKDNPLVSDAQYDVFERKLKALVESNPKLARMAAYAGICPLTRPGSSLADDYPRRIEQLAESLLEYHGTAL